MKVRYPRLAIALLLGCPAAAQALEPIWSMRPRLFPEHPTERDRRYIGFYDRCGREQILSPVRLVAGPIVASQFTMQLTLRDEEWLCPAGLTPFTSALHLVELPSDLPIDSVRVTVKKFGVVQHDESILVRNAAPLPPSVAGAWNNPAHPAQGVYLSFTTLPSASGLNREAIAMTWTTYDAAGEPMWLAGTATLAPQSPSAPTYTVDFPLYAMTGGAFPSATQVPPSISTWGTARLEYLACDRLSLRWFPVDGVAFPPGAIELRQLLYSATQPCDIERYEADHYRRVTIITPVVE